MGGAGARGPLRAAWTWTTPIEMVREKTAARYPVEQANEETQTKFEELSSYASNIVGINKYLDKADGWEHSDGRRLERRVRHAEPTVVRYTNRFIDKPAGAGTPRRRP